MSVLCLSPQQVAQSLAYILLVCHEIVIYVYINNGSPMIPLKTSVRKIGGNCSIGNRSFFSSRQNQLLPLKQYNYFTGDTLIKRLAVALEIEFWCHLMKFFFSNSHYLSCRLLHLSRLFNILFVLLSTFGSKIFPFIFKVGRVICQIWSTQKFPTVLLFPRVQLPNVSAIYTSTADFSVASKEGKLTTLSVQ